MEQFFQNTTQEKFTLLLLLLLFQPIIANGKCSCEPQQTKNEINQSVLLHYKLAGIASILFASAVGVCIPLLLKNIKSLQPESPIHFLIKSFAAGVILATGFLHILPDAFDSLNDPCLGEAPWLNFPFAGFIAVVSAVATMIMEAVATGYHRRAELQKAQPLDGDVEDDHGRVLSSTILLERSSSSNLVRFRIISQVLEMGIVVHSVIIGISLGTSHRQRVVKPLIAALSFHQFFEGMGLGGCIAQAKFKARTIITMVLFFSLTTPTGIAIGVAISKGYDEASSTALIVQGVLNSASAGILIYMALVDLLAPDLVNPKLQTDFKLQIGTHLALLLGAGLMSLLAKWNGS